MFSIKRTLGFGGDESTLREVIALLVKKMGETAVVADRDDLEGFRDEIKFLHEGLIPDLPIENLLISTGSATQALETYNRRITKTIINQSSDFRAVMKLMQDHLSTMSGLSNNSVEGLSKISEELENSANFQDLHPLKLHLTQCLSGLREEIEREKSASKDLIEKLRTDIEGFRGSGPGRSDSSAAFDSVTGLPSQAECGKAIQAAIDKGTRHCVVVMVVSRVQAINARFGMDAGDRMLLRFKQLIETKFAPPDRLFRWTGPALVAVLERPQPLPILRALVKRMVDHRAEETFQFDGRSVMIQISATWSVFPLEATMQATEKHIHAFIASQSSQDA